MVQKSHFIQVLSNNSSNKQSSHTVELQTVCNRRVIFCNIHYNLQTLQDQEHENNKHTAHNKKYTIVALLFWGLEIANA